MELTAAILEKLGEPLVIYKLDIPELKPGQVLVKVLYSGICHSQLMEARGKRGKDSYLPHMLGHEGSGVVIDVGEGVKKVKKGDRVILGWIKGKGADVPGTQYTSGNKIINAGGITTFSNYSVISENRCVIKPKGIPDDVAVLFGCALPTGAGIVMHHVKPEPDTSLLILGLGGIGFSALMASGLFQCKEIIAADIDDSKLELAEKFGATRKINTAKQDLLAEVYSITKGRGVDYSIEAAGLAETIETAFRAVRKSGGLCVFASHPKHGDRIKLDPHELISGKRIEGSWGGSCFPDKDVPDLARIYLEGRLPLENMVKERYRLAQINIALEDLEQRKILRAIIEMEH